VLWWGGEEKERLHQRGEDTRSSRANTTTMNLPPRYRHHHHYHHRPHYHPHTNRNHPEAARSGMRGKIYLALDTAENVQSWMRLRRVVFLQSTADFTLRAGYVVTALLVFEASAIIWIVKSISMEGSSSSSSGGSSSSSSLVPVVAIIDLFLLNLYLLGVVWMMALSNHMLKSQHSATLAKAKYELVIQSNNKEGEESSSDEVAERDLTQRAISMLNAARERIVDVNDAEGLLLRILGIEVTLNIVVALAVSLAVVFLAGLVLVIESG